MPSGAAISLVSLLPPNPLAGNILARRLRYIHENTDGIFSSNSATEDEGGTLANDQNQSNYELEYNARFADKPEYRQPLEPPSIFLNPRPKTQQVVGEQDRAFMQWKLPHSITGEEETERVVQSARASITAPSPVMPQKSATPRLPSLASRAGSRKASAAAPPPGTAASRRLGSPRRSSSKPVSARPQGFQNGVAPRAAELLRAANPSERRVIEKALLLAEHSAINDSLRRALLPEAEVQVRKWLETASPEEREVALNFFHNLSGNKVMTESNPEKKDRLFKVLKALESGESGYISQSHPHFTVGDGSSSLQHVRLLTPNTRRNRWIHTTWHHLPPYHDSNPVDNRSSHFALPHRQMRRHFVIHPDW